MEESGFYQSVIENTSVGYSYNKIIYNDNGEPQDYEFVEVNEAYELMLGIEGKDWVGKRISELYKSVKKNKANWDEFHSKHFVKLAKEGRDEMTIKVVPEWMVHLENEDVVFIKKFILNSGSLKEMAKAYEVTYPTVRLRLDKLIQKIEIADRVEEDSYISLIKRYAVDDKIDFETAKVLISEYRKNIEEADLKWAGSQLI